MIIIANKLNKLQRIYSFSSLLSTFFFSILQQLPEQQPEAGQPIHRLPFFFSFHMKRIAAPIIINRIPPTIQSPIVTPSY